MDYIYLYIDKNSSATHSVLVTLAYTYYTKSRCCVISNLVFYLCCESKSFLCVLPGVINYPSGLFPCTFFIKIYGHHVKLRLEWRNHKLYDMKTVLICFSRKSRKGIFYLKHKNIKWLWMHITLPQPNKMMSWSQQS